eukprot:TRINITY_DN1940_c0_g1_i6.p1 TRINITY_DN1940_c0_g1~~TRINITY_DN1940_c0_g1_i6.p1  ORF type:complete len:104 (+),score=22.57 TRINITY_DN1940_c0_g1_i6:98-409(+)
MSRRPPRSTLSSSSAASDVYKRQQDYRNGVKWYHFDPTKWLIRSFEAIGWARGLVRTPTDVMDKNYFKVKHDKHARAVADYNTRLETLDKLSLIHISEPTRPY